MLARIVSAVTLQTDVPSGLTGRAELVVCEADTARALRSGDVQVLGTPRLIALCEQATVAALGSCLPSGWTTVAMRVQFDHVAPVAEGSAVAADAVLDKVEGRRLFFTVTATDQAGLIGAGRVIRVAVERERFLSKSR